MSEKLTTGKIEQKLLGNAKSECVNEIIRAARSFADVVNQYRPHEHEEVEVFQKWINGFFASYWGIEPKEDAIADIPEYVQKRLLNKAVKDFMDTIDSLKNQIDEVYELAEDHY